MTVRNIRAHQTRGLLPPPVVRGRTGYYNEEHVARIELTREMQADGPQPRGDPPRASRPATARRRARSSTSPAPLRAPFEDETPGDLRAGRARRDLGGEGGRPEADRAAAKSWASLRALPDGRIEVISPRLQRAGGRAGRSSASAPRRRSPPPKSCAATPTASPAPSSSSSSRRSGSPSTAPAGPRRTGRRIREALERMRPLASDAPARRLPDRDGRGDREGERAHAARRGGQGRPQKAEKGRQTARR